MDYQPTFKSDMRDGKFGKTAQFWTAYYLDIIYNLHMLHLSIITNNFDLRLCAIKKILPYCFALNKQTYSRYGSIYVATLEKMDSIYPGCKETLEQNGISVQVPDRYLHRVHIYQRGEQTVNRDAKTSEGIKFFISDENAHKPSILHTPSILMNCIKWPISINLVTYISQTDHQK